MRDFLPGRGHIDLKNSMIVRNLDTGGGGMLVQTLFAAKPVFWVADGTQFADF